MRGRLPGVGHGATPNPQVTELLRLSREGAPAARDRVFEIVHEDLRRLAAKMLRGGFRRSAVMQTTMLVNSAVERLLERNALDAENRRHLFALLGRAMHDVLVEEARAQGAIKRGGGRAPDSLSTGARVASEDPPMSADELESLRKALDELAAHDPAAAETVWLRSYCGRTIEETAELMNTTFAIVRGNWEYAQAWLADRLGDARGTGT